MITDYCIPIRLMNMAEDRRINAMLHHRWRVSDTEGHLMANELTGTYYGRSQAHKPRNTEGVLFSTDLATDKRAQYHCIAWEEL